MEFAERLCSLMDERGISAYRISKDTGISDRLIGYWKGGEKVPTATNLTVLADYIDVSVDYLLGRTDNPEINK